MDSAKRENLVNSAGGFTGLAWLWIVSNLTTINQVLVVLGSLGGVILVYFAIVRAVIGRRRESRADRREEMELKRIEESMTRDRSVISVPQQPPTGELEE